MSLLRLLFRLFYGRRLPITEGNLDLLLSGNPPSDAGNAKAGNTSLRKGQILIRRDKHGIPMIDADDPLDGAFAVGFCHGQDRPFQLELLQRVVRGTLAAMVGVEALPLDLLSRRVGFRRSAIEQWPLLASDIRGMLEAYSAGVNAGTSLGSRKVAHEFAILGRDPTPWEAFDSLAMSKLLSFSLTSNWDSELVRLKILELDGVDALRALDPTYPEWHPVTSPVGGSAGPAIDRLAADLSVFLKWVRPGGGSNNWALSAERTATGRPILANDPHLDARLPCHWYFVRVRTNAWNVAGATLVGGPNVLAGHNEYGAWGPTAGLIDNTDLFLEEIDGDKVRDKAGFIPYRVVTEEIEVKGGETVTEYIRITPRGPIISPALAGVKQALSLRATWLDPRPLGGLFRIHSAKSFSDFRALFADWPASGQNMVWADTTGTIGWQLIGRVPQRRKGFGLLPLPGYDPDVGWGSQLLPYDQMPWLENPQCGYIATANTLPKAHGDGPFLGMDVIDGYRLMSINEKLAEQDQWTIAETMKLQINQEALAWREMREVVLQAPTNDARTKQAVELLKKWDGVVGVESAAASIYELFLVDMICRVAQKKAPNSWRWVVGESFCALTQNFACYRRTGHLVRLLRDQPEGWFEEGWPTAIADSLAEAVTTLVGRWGKNPKNWAWGRIRQLLMHHPFAQVKGMAGAIFQSVFNLGPVDCGGDDNVIAQAATLPLDPLGTADNIASMRMVIDVGQWENSRFVLPGGQSGNPLSPHYGDQFQLWQKGEGVPIAFGEEAVKKATVATLRLRVG
jgi:penicillin amidase